MMNPCHGSEPQRVVPSWKLIHDDDSVAVALQDLPAGTEVELMGSQLRLGEAIPTGHKFALVDILLGEPVIKYGFPIGEASQPIEAGQWVYTHNLKTRLGDTLEYQYHPRVGKLGEVKARSFQGYLREDGQVGIRNEVWIVPTVGCVNEVAKALAKKMNEEITVESGVDGVHAWPHPLGCSQWGMITRAPDASWLV